MAIGLSFYLGAVHTKKTLEALTPEGLSEYASLVGQAKRCIPFSNNSAWNKLGQLSDWIKEIRAKRSA